MENRRRDTTGRRRRGGRWRGWLTLALAIYLAPLVCLALFQEGLMFHPGHYTDVDWPASRLPADMARVMLRTRDGGAVEALFGPALLAHKRTDPEAAHRPTLLYFHGNGGDLRDTFGEVQKLRRLDCNVMAVDYVGYGVNTRPPTERGCYEAADAAYDALVARPDIDRSRIVILGHSLGTAVAVDLAARTLRAHRPLAGLALVSGFTSMPDEGHTQYPIYPTFLLRLVARNRFESARKMAQITCPVFIAHSRSDALIPYAMSDGLAAACPGPVTRLAFDHVPHGYAFSTGAPQVLPALRAFVEKSPREDSPPSVTLAPSLPCTGRRLCPLGQPDPEGASGKGSLVYTYALDGKIRRYNITDWALGQFRDKYGPDMTKQDIFHYVYGILHSPQYRERYKESLKRELPRVPLVEAEPTPAASGDPSRNGKGEAVAGPKPSAANPPVSGGTCERSERRWVPRLRRDRRETRLPARRLRERRRVPTDADRQQRHAVDVARDEDAAE